MPPPAMLSRSMYQVLLVVLTLAAVAGGLWLVISPTPSPGVEITLPPTPSSPATEGALPEAEEESPPALIDINTATAQVLEGLPGIGEVLAARIVAYREEHGLFQRTDQLMAVSGIGPVKYQDIRHLVAAGQ